MLVLVHTCCSCRFFSSEMLVKPDPSLALYVAGLELCKLFDLNLDKVDVVPDYDGVAGHLSK